VPPDAHTKSVRVDGVQWDNVNRRHFRENHRCTFGEVEDVLLSTCHRSRCTSEKRQPGAEPRLWVDGQACTERFLVVISTPRPNFIQRPVTCVYPSDRDLTRYLAWRLTTRRASGRRLR
jgi:uncharacterized DUF497 family protein